MIDNFKQFELNRSTYVSAANKADSLGHNKRYKDLINWSKIGGKSINTKKTPSEIGKVSFDFSIYQYTDPFKVSPYDKKNVTEIKALSANSVENLNQPYNYSNAKNFKLIKQGPIEGYITDVRIEETIYDAKEEMDCICLMIDCLYVDEKGLSIRETGRFSTPFFILIPIEWNNSGNKSWSFIIKEEFTINGSEDHNPIMFSNRKSAAKFVKLLRNFSEYYPTEEERLSEFFKEFSYSSEWKKFNDLLKTIHPNILYKE